LDRELLFLKNNDFLLDIFKKYFILLAEICQMQHAMTDGIWGLLFVRPSSGINATTQIALALANQAKLDNILTKESNF
jgi:hypothetical protein